MSTRIIGLGAGGHAKVIVELLRACGGFEIVGLLDARSDMCRQMLLDVPILGSDSLLPSLREQGIGTFFLGVGTVGDASPRRRLYELATNHGFAAATLLHPSSVVSRSANLGKGTVVMAGAIVNACASVGINGIINTGAIIEHDCAIGDHVHVATGAKLAGSVRLGNGVHVGVGATVRQGIRIGDGAIVGAGAVVVRDVPPGVTVIGVPAQPMKSRDDRGQG
jgi:UDP-perosamine 4-acetyltransferase